MARGMAWRRIFVYGALVWRVRGPRLRLGRRRILFGAHVELCAHVVVAAAAMAHSHGEAPFCYCWGEMRQPWRDVMMCWAQIGSYALRWWWCGGGGGSDGGSGVWLSFPTMTTAARGHLPRSWPRCAPVRGAIRCGRSWQRRGWARSMMRVFSPGRLCRHVRAMKMKIR